MPFYLHTGDKSQGRIHTRSAAVSVRYYSNSVAARFPVFEIVNELIMLEPHFRCKNFVRHQSTDWTAARIREQSHPVSRTDSRPVKSFTYFCSSMRHFIAAHQVHNGDRQTDMAESPRFIITKHGRKPRWATVTQQNASSKCVITV